MPGVSDLSVVTECPVPDQVTEFRAKFSMAGVQMT